MTKHLPKTLRTINDLTPARLDRFKAWLAERGAQVLSPTNEYELLRFRAHDWVGIVYRKANGALTLHGNVAEAWWAFREGLPWSGAVKAKRPNSGKRSVLIRRLLERDGGECFFCGLPTTDEDRTIEDLLPVSAGGPAQHIANQALAHQRCNQEAGHLPIVEKVKLREQMRAEARRHAVGIGRTLGETAMLLNGVLQ